MYDKDFSEGPNPQDAIAPQTHEVQEAGLRIAKATDHRDFDDWATDESLCQTLLTDRPREWRTALQRYWRERCTRRELANELGLDLESVKNLLRRIRKGAKDFKSGKARKHAVETQWPGRPHAEIDARDIFAICIDRDPDAIARAEEYRRLATINQLLLFDPAISGELVRLFEETTVEPTLNVRCDLVEQEKLREVKEREVNNNTLSQPTSRLLFDDVEPSTAMLARADALKASVAKDDPFVGRALFQTFKGREPNYHFDRRGRPRKETHAPDTKISSDEATPRDDLIADAGVPRAMLIPASSNYFLDSGMTNNFNEEINA